MYSKLLVIVAAAASVAAQCPPVWNTISQELTGHFLTGGECNGNARQAIRAAFHDCGAWNLGQGETGGCDGSMMLAEMDRLENQAMAPIAAILTEIATRHSVSVADTIQFAACRILCFLARPRPIMLTIPLSARRCYLPRRSSRSDLCRTS